MAPDRNGNPGRIKVIFDANALMIPGQFGVDIFSEIEVVLGSYESLTLEDVLSELKGISTGKGRDSSAARVGIMLSKRCRVVSGPYSGLTVDDRIISYAEYCGGIVATNDRGLKERLLDKNIDVITLRKQKTFEIIKA